MRLEKNEHDDEQQALAPVLPAHAGKRLPLAE